MPGKRIVLLEMATEDAEDFVRRVVQSGSVGGFYPREEGEEHLTPAAKEFPAAAEAVVARPTVWCRCDVPQESRAQRRRRQARRESGWTRGATFGWWCCSHCRKPSRAVVKHWVTSMLAGANDLLPKILGEGDPLSPSHRWARDGGGENPHANANHVQIATTAGPSRRSSKPRKPKARRI